MSFTINCTFPSRRFRSVSLLLQDGSGAEVELPVHPLILSLRSQFFDKVLFPFEVETFQSEEAKDKTTPGQTLTLQVPDAYSAADVINSFYGETTNSGQRHGWERDLTLAYAKDFLLVEKLSLDFFLKEIPKTQAEFSKYLSLALSFLDANGDKDKISKETFLADMMQKVGDFYQFFGEEAAGVMAVLEEKNFFSAAIVETLVQKMPFEDTKAFEGLVGLLELYQKEEPNDQTWAKIWEELDFSIGGKYPEVGQEYRARYQKLGFSKTEKETPKNIVGVGAAGVLSFNLENKSGVPKLYGYTCGGAKSFVVTKEGFYLTTTSGVYTSDFEGNERMICPVSMSSPSVIAVDKNMVYVMNGSKSDVYVFDSKTGHTLWSYHCKNVGRGYIGQTTGYRDNHENFFWVNGFNVYRIKAFSSSPEVYRSNCLDPSANDCKLTISKKGTYFAFSDPVNESIYLVNWQTKSAKRVSPSSDTIFFSCCEKYIVLSRYEGTYVCKTENYPDVHKNFPGTTLGVSDKRRLLVLFHQGKLIVQDFDGKQVSTVEMDVKSCIKDTEVSFSDDCQWLAVSTPSLTNVYKVSSGELVLSKCLRLNDVKFY